MDDCCNSKANELSELGERKSVLKIVLILNLIMFFVEGSFGLRANSTSLLADSLDMLGDAFVYGISLYVIGKSAQMNATVALLKGFIMLALGVSVVVEAVIRFNSLTLPVPETIGIIGTMALAVNLVCAWLLLRHRNDDLNMRSVWLCSRNDVIANIGVLVAGGMVALTQSKYPDLIVGLVIALLVLRSAYGVLTESYRTLKAVNS